MSKGVFGLDIELDPDIQILHSNVIFDTVKLRYS